MYHVSAEINNIEYLDQICPKRLFPVYSRKTEHHHWILEIRINLTTKFWFKLTILNFWTKFAQKRYSRSQKNKQTSKQTNKQTNKQKGTRKVKISIESNHRTLHIRIRLCAEFQLKLAILIFWTRFPQKGISSVKKSTSLLNSTYFN